MDPSRYLAALARGRRLIALTVLLGALAGLAATLLSTPQYRATTTAYFGLSRGNSVSELVQGSTYTQSLVQSFAELATKPVVLDPVIAEQRLDTTSVALARRVDVDLREDTTLLDITATAPDAAESARLADAIARQLSSAVSRLASAGPDASTSITGQILYAAAEPTGRSSPRPVLNVGVGALLGLLLGAVLAVLQEALDGKVRSEDDVASLTDAPVLGMLPQARERPLVSARSADPLTEAFRRLRTNLFSPRMQGGPRCFVITSPAGGEGASTVAVNLAVTMAESGLRVVLVETDLRSPSLARMLSLRGRTGLTTMLLKDDAELADVVQPSSDRLDVLTAGPQVDRPSELLGSETMVKLMEALRQQYDLVVLDGAALLAVTDATVLAQYSDGALVVVDARRTGRRRLTEGLHLLEVAGATTLGVVVNRVPLAGTPWRPLSRRARTPAVRVP